MHGVCTSSTILSYYPGYLMTYLALELVDELVSPALGISVHSLPLLLFR